MVGGGGFRFLAEAIVVVVEHAILPGPCCHPALKPAPTPVRILRLVVEVHLEPRRPCISLPLQQEANKKHAIIQWTLKCTPQPPKSVNGSVQTSPIGYVVQKAQTNDANGNLCFRTGILFGKRFTGISHRDLPHHLKLRTLPESDLQHTITYRI